MDNKKIIFSTFILLLILSLFFNSAVLANQSEEDFKDLPKDHWAYEAVNDLVDKGIISGYSDELFKGENKVSRYEMAVIVNKMLKYVSKNDDTIKTSEIAELLERKNDENIEPQTVKSVEETFKNLLEEFNSELKEINGDKIQLERSITLQVKEKDPRIAYGNATIPIFGPTASANYVRSTPAINPYRQSDNELMNRATRQTFYNIGEIGAGILLDYMTKNNQTMNRVPFTFVGYFVAIWHNHYFGKDMADRAVEYNKELHKKFEWKYPGVSIDF